MTINHLSTPLLVSFVASETGRWKIDSIDAVKGQSLSLASHLEVIEGYASADPTQAWTLRGTTSNLRYTTRSEARTLTESQEGLNRPFATKAALIPIRKTDAWWSLAQDERRTIFEARSRHIAIGLEFLPEIARRLHHSRELSEPFDFLTWFEYAPEHSDAFEQLVAKLRATSEWEYVDREIDIRLTRV